MLFNKLKRLADNYMQIWNAESEGLLDIYAVDDLIVEYTHFKRIEGIGNYKKFLQNTYEAFPDMRVSIDSIFPNYRQESATIFWKYSGTHQKHSLFGVEPQGIPISINGMTFLQFAKNKVTLERGIIDNLSLLMQLNQKGRSE